MEPISYTVSIDTVGSAMEEMHTLDRGSGPPPYVPLMMLGHGTIAHA